jgi:endonuclease YncB( thermonuclease family)
MVIRERANVELIRVIDGDTILVRYTCPACRISFEKRVRLAEIDAAELDGPERGQALLAREQLAGLLTGRNIWIVPFRRGEDCYGRIRARVFTDEGDVSRLMIDRFKTPLYKPLQGSKLIV